MRKRQRNAFGVHSSQRLCPKLHESLNLDYQMMRSIFEDINKALFDKTLECVKKVTEDANKKPEDITDIVLVGGSSKIPCVRKMLSDFFHKNPCNGVDPECAIAFGAANEAALHHKNSDLNSKPMKLLFETSHRGIIPRYSKVPTMAVYIRCMCMNRREIAKRRLNSLFTRERMK